jgi:hypothetical protein
MSSESECQVAHSWVRVGSFHTRLVVRFIIFTASVRNILDTPSYMSTIRSPLSRLLATSNFCLTLIVFRRCLTWIALGSADLRSSRKFSTKSKCSRSRNYMIRVIISPMKSTFVSEVRVTSLSVGLLPNKDDNGSCMPYRVKP